MKIGRLLCAMVACVAVASCSSQQLYSAGRSYQGNECVKRQDDEERERCMKDANMPYDDYRREAVGSYK